MTQNELTKEWLSGLKVGDKAAIVGYSYGQIFMVNYTTIKKITPTRIIVTETGHRYRPDGTGMDGDGSLRNNIEPVSEKTDGWLYTRKAMSIINKTQFEKLPVAKLKAIIEIIKSDP